eukprot:635845-Amphidinium_carterae.1
MNYARPSSCLPIQGHCVCVAFTRILHHLAFKVIHSNRSEHVMQHEPPILAVAQASLCCPGSNDMCAYTGDRCAPAVRQTQNKLREPSL